MARLNTKQWAQYHARLAERYWPAVVRGAKVGALRGIAILQQKTQAAIPASPRGSIGAVDRGRFLQSWKQSVSDTEVRFWNEAPHASTIEEGRAAGKRPPPTKALVPWVKRKLGIGADEARGVAFVVARAIGRRGLAGRHVLGGSVGELREALEAEILDSLKKVTKP